MPVVWPAVGACVLPNIGGWVGSYAVSKSYATWYQTLKKPKWTPPKYVFAPIWTGIYTSMGYASYLVWRDGGGFQGEAAIPLALYGAQLLMNWTWTPIFFGYRSIKWGLINIMMLGISVATCAVTFNPINKTASLLMLPYIAWLGLATSLNYYIYQNNESKEE